jgi:hypothetical protein
MKENSTLEKKLLKYSALTAGAVAITAGANAQLGYTDINPDSVLVNNLEGADINFDGDANVDLAVGKQVASFTGSTGSSSSPGVVYNIAYQAAFAVTLPGNTVMTVSSGEPAALALNTVIDAAGAFAGIDSGSFLGAVAATTFPAYPGYSYTQQLGQWVGANDLYLGAKFMIGANTHYGWVRMSLSADAVTLTVKDYAYNMVANGPINAGAMGLGIAVNSDELALVNFANNRLDVNVIDGTNGNLTIINMEGKVVYNGSLNNYTQSIDLSSMSAGLYVVNAEFTEGSFQQKIVVR